MSFSINYNYSAAIAVQALNATQDSLDQALSRSSTGLRVQTASDDGLAFAASEQLKNVVAREKAVLDTIATGSGTVSQALQNLTRMTKLVQDMTTLATQATDPTLSTAARTSLEDEAKALGNQYDAIKASASLTSATTAYTYALDFLALTGAAGGTSVSVTGFNPARAAVAGTALNLSTPTNAAAVATSLVTLNATLVTGSTRLATAQKAFDDAKQVNTALIAAQNKSIGALVDADMGEESAKIQSLQIKQQLNVQAISVANADMRVLLTLFGA